mmetsp:Transcript_20276/g.43518  ORF Transcript_20276/g.43518 Transcript_20276/m.43518 type:complete len:304 (+) Transcript_20276:375-1286(+)
MSNKPIGIRVIDRSGRTISVQQEPPIQQMWRAHASCSTDQQSNSSYQADQPFAELPQSRLLAHVLGFGARLVLGQGVLPKWECIVPAARPVCHGGVHRHVGQRRASEVVGLADAGLLRDRVEGRGEERVLVAEEALGVGDEPRREGVGAHPAALAPRRLGHEEHVAELAVLVGLVRVVLAAVDHREARAALEPGERAQPRPLLGPALLAAFRGGVVHTTRCDNEPRLPTHLQLRGKQVIEEEVAEVVSADGQLEAVGGELLLPVANIEREPSVEHQGVERATECRRKCADRGEAAQVALSADG